MKLKPLHQRSFNFVIKCIIIRFQVLGYQSEMSSLHKETSSIEIQIAKLQESKKSAVSGNTILNIYCDFSNCMVLLQWLLS